MCWIPSRPTVEKSEPQIGDSNLRLSPEINSRTRAGTPFFGRLYGEHRPLNLRSACRHHDGPYTVVR